MRYQALGAATFVYRLVLFVRQVTWVSVIRVIE